MITDIYDVAYYRQGKPPPPAWPAENPPPEVTTRDTGSAEPLAPASVRKLAALGADGGWRVRFGYSRSPERAVRVGTYKITEAWGVSGGPGHASGFRWCALYTRTVGRDWSWRNTAIWRPTAYGRYTWALLTDLQEFILARGDVGTPWFKAVQARVVAQAEEQRARAKVASRNRKPKEGAS